MLDASTAAATTDRGISTTGRRLCLIWLLFIILIITSERYSSCYLLLLSYTFNAFRWFQLSLPLAYVWKLYRSFIGKITSVGLDLMYVLSQIRCFTLSAHLKIKRLKVALILLQTIPKLEYVNEDSEVGVILSLNNFPVLSRAFLAVSWFSSLVFVIIMLHLAVGTGKYIKTQCSNDQIGEKQFNPKFHFNLFCVNIVSS